MRCISLIYRASAVTSPRFSIHYCPAFPMTRNNLPPRRSPRFLTAQASIVTPDDTEEDDLVIEEETFHGSEPKKRSRVQKRSADTKSRATTTTKRTKQSKAKDEATSVQYLPRTREIALKQEGFSFVMGIDEAGRGPLCGPVVVGAAMVPANIEGITDSKKITKESQRDVLYDRILQSPNIRWAVAVMDATKIDQINILQATLEGMRLCAQAVLSGKVVEEEYTKQSFASIEHTGCYIVCGATNAEGNPIEILNSMTKKKAYALIDGNRLPKDMPCEAETIVKGDSREYSIAAASILAKVTRDRLMHGYDELYPEYDLKQNKGYPTAFHMKAVKQHGATIIHRRTFAPLKHMRFDTNGEVVQEEESSKDL